MESRPEVIELYNDNDILFEAVDKTIREYRDLNLKLSIEGKERVNRLESVRNEGNPTSLRNAINYILLGASYGLFHSWFKRENGLDTLLEKNLKAAGIDTKPAQKASLWEGIIPHSAMIF